MQTTGPRKGIERKILASILRVAVFPLAIALIVGFLSAREGLGNAVRQTLLTAAQKTTAGLRIAADSHLGAMSSLAASPQLVAALMPDANGAPSILSQPDVRAAFARLMPRAEDIYLTPPAIWALYDAAGKPIASTADLPTGQEVFQQPPWLGKTSPDFVDVHYFARKKQYLAQTIAPVHDPETDECIGYLSEFFDISPMLKFALGFDPYRPGERSREDVYQVLYGREGAMVASGLDEKSDPDKPVLSIPESVSPQLVAILRRPANWRGASFFMRDYQSHGRSMAVFLAYDRLFDATDIYILVYRPAWDVYNDLLLWAALATGFCVLLVVVLCYHAYRNVHNNIVRPVLLLNEGAQIIGQGDLELKLKIGSGDEIEELATSFNKMALALKRNIHQLEDSEEKYRSLVTSMRDGVFQASPGGTIGFLNPAALDIFGFASVQELSQHNFPSMFLESADMTRFGDELNAKGFVERSRVWMKRRDGRAICVELSGNLVRDNEGRVVSVEGIFRDVTTSVRLEREVRERAERLSAINQIANVINSSLEAGRLYESLVVEVKKLVDFDYAELALLRASGDAFDVCRLWPDREEQPARTCRFEDDAPWVACWVARQRECLIIDDLMATETTVTDVPSRAEPATQTDTSGEAEPPSRTEPASAFAFQFPRETRSCIGVPLYATGRIIGTLNLGANHPGAFSSHDEEVLEQMAPHVAVAIRNAQLLENLQVSLEEVTRARERLHAVNEELKTLDEMKTNLLSNVSHELRTPLVAIMGYTDMIINGKCGPITDVQREYLGISLRNIDKLVTLIENLLDFSRLHRGQEQIVFDVFDLVDCARASLQIVQPLADNRQIHLTLDAPSTPVLVEGDKSKIGQVFNNLLSNAVKFNQNDGSVILSIRPGDDSVSAAVRDTGIGIPPEALDKVFTRFYQYDSSSTRKYGGTGIGLSIAQDIVRLHGGRIEVSSEVGKGSVFRFRLPLAAQQPEQVGAPKAGAPSDADGETHLLVELVTHDRSLADQVRQLLRPEGMDVIHAATLAGAIALSEKYDPDCLIVDMDLDAHGGSPGPAPALARGPGSGNGLNILDRLMAAVRGQGTSDSTVSSPPRLLSAPPIVLLTDDDALYERCRPVVASRLRRGFRKSTLLTAIQYAATHGPDIQTEAPAPPAPAPSAPRKILCVDDDPEILSFMSRCLGAEGYSVDVCETGEEALDRAATGEYGVVLLDIAMPGMDGWETCRRIKAIEAAPGSGDRMGGMMVFMITAKHIEKERAQERLREAGAAGYLLKPFRPEDLVEVVRGAEAHWVIARSTEPSRA